MNEYLKKYIELQKKFHEPKGKSDSVHALHAFQEELEQTEDPQAKEVLVNVYHLLDYKNAPMICSVKSEINAIRRFSNVWQI